MLGKVQLLIMKAKIKKKNINKKKLKNSFSFVKKKEFLN